MIIIKTYQDLIAVGENERARMEFILDAVSDYKGTTEYATAVDAEEYYAHRNPTIMRYQKFVFNQFGKKVPDVWSANNKIASNWYEYFTTQAVQYLLGNGVSFKDKATKDKLGKKFDKKMQDAATYAKNGGRSYLFWNNGTVEVFNATEFVPFLDEETSALMAGVRFWQIADDKPLRMTLYEVDGVTEYVKKDKEEVKLLKEKTPYVTKGRVSKADGVEITGAVNYKKLPIVCMYNVKKQSDLVGNQGTIDAYDLMTSGLVNNVSDGEFIYWILKNCGGMSDMDDVQFYERLRTTHVAHADGDSGDAEVQAHQVEVPFEASAEALDRLEKQLYRDFMALRVDDVAAGATNDQIQAAYEPLNQKTDDFEYCVTDAIESLLEIAGIDDAPTYTRSQMSNQTETMDMVLAAAQYLDDEYVTKKILTLLGDADMVEEVMQRKIADESTRFDEE